MTLLITVNITHLCNVTFINVISKVILCKVFYMYCYSFVYSLDKFGRLRAACLGRHDTHHNNIQNNGIQHNDIQNNDT